MKENWTYKKLGEVGTVIGGSTPKTDVPEFWNGDFAWITPAELDGSKCVSSTIRTITEEAVKKTNLTLLPIGTVLLSSRAPIGKVCITKIPMYCNQGFKNIVCSDELNNEFLYWWLKGKSDFLNSLGVGATFKEISKRIVEQIVIPVPPIETQSRIVSELDLLQSIIDKQKAQLNELDNLAQAVFYDMFGDPIENEKGWEVTTIGNVCASKKDIKRAVKHFNAEDNISYIDISAIDNIRNVITTPTPFQFRDAPSRAQQVVVMNDILISLVRPNLNNVAIVSNENNNLVASSGFCVLRASKEIQTTFLFFIVKMKQFTDYLMSRVSGANYPAVREDDITGYRTILPPLSLQQSFATKIESIEKQKAAITQSIAETQRLFDYTMDKYFG